MKLETAKRYEKSIKAAAQALNDIIFAAHSEGLAIDMEVQEVSFTRTVLPCPFARVSVKIKPDDIEV